MLSTAIVILNYNTRSQLEQFLPAVIRHSDRPGVRVIVADNGSRDDSADWVSRHCPGVELIRLPSNSGFAGGYNQALTQVEADLFVLLNSDVEVTPDWLDPILDRFDREPSLAAVQPKILSWRDKHAFEYAGAAGGYLDILGYPFCRGRFFDHVEADNGQYNQSADIYWATGAAMFVRASLFRDFGGFDSDYFAHLEEIDLCQRFKQAGYRISCEPRSVVYHVGGGTLSYQHPRKTFLNFRNSWITLLKNESTGKLIWLVPIRWLLDIVAALFFLAKAEIIQAGSVFRAQIYIFRQFFRILNKRKNARATVERFRIGPPDRAGLYRGSIVFQYFILKKNAFSDLNVPIITPDGHPV